jgi:hypothetical protein
MLAALGAKDQEMGARRIVFDALDIVLALLPDRRRKGGRFTGCMSGCWRAN